jgi:hypothetical protein
LLTGHFFQATAGEQIGDGPAEPPAMQHVPKTEDIVSKSKSELLKKQDFMVRQELRAP